MGHVRVHIEIERKIILISGVSYHEIIIKICIYKLDFCLTVHHQLGKVIQMNQLDATVIYWSIISTQHVLGNILPIIRSMMLRFLQHMVSCCCGGHGDGERRCVHIVPRCRSPSPCPPQQQDTICCKYLSLTLLMMGKILPKTCW